MYDTKNLIYLFTMLECCEKAWIYTKEFNNPNDFIWANEQKELLIDILNSPYYKHLDYLSK